MMKVTIKILKGSECTIEVDGSSTVSKLKKAVENELQIDAALQKLVYKGHTLRNENTLTECGILTDSKLILVVKKAESPDVFEQLYALLSKHFSSSDATKVMVEYRKNFDTMIGNLSLDDIERIASANLMEQER